MKGYGVIVNSSATFEKLLVLPEYQNTYGQGSNGQFSYKDGNGGGVNDNVDESWDPKMDGRLMPQCFSNGEAVPFVAHPDNVKDFYETGYTLNNGLAIAGRSVFLFWEGLIVFPHCVNQIPNPLMNLRSDH